VILATPLAATGLVVVNRLYVGEVLGDDQPTPTDHQDSSSPPKAAAD
jgi:hypothetical protein